MEPGAEVLRVVAAIVTTFQTSVEVLEDIKIHKEKKKRKRDREVEELFEITILHKSLVQVSVRRQIRLQPWVLADIGEHQGGLECRRHCENRRSRFSPAFEVGDAVALPALKDVVINLQAEIVQGLHIARADESAVLDFVALYEASITCRKDATRAMDQLCQRIVTSMQCQSQRWDQVHTPAWSPSDFSIRSASASVQQRLGLCDVSPATPQQPTDKRFPSPPATIDGVSRSLYQAIPRVRPQRSTTISRPSDNPSQECHAKGNLPLSMASVLLPEVSRPEESHTNSWTSIADTGLSDPRSSADEQQSSSQSPPTPPEINHSNSGPTEPLRAQNFRNDENSTGEPFMCTVDAKRMSAFSIQPSVFESRQKTELGHSTHVSSTSIVTHLQFRRAPSHNDSPLESEKPDSGSLNATDQKSTSLFSTDRHPLSNPLGEAQAGDDSASFIRSQKLQNSTPASLSIGSRVKCSMSPPDLRRSLSAPSSLRETTHLHFTIDGGPCGTEQAYPVMKDLDSSDTHRQCGRPIPDSQTGFLHPKHATSPAEPPGVPYHMAIAFAEQINSPYRVPTTVLSHATPPHNGAREQEVVYSTSQEPGVIGTSQVRLPLHGEKAKELNICSSQVESTVLGEWDVQFTEKIRPTADLMNEKISASLTQADYQERLACLSNGVEHIWLPLARPALHNMYHGFCRGAWQIRRAVGIFYTINSSLCCEETDTSFTIQVDKGLRVDLTPGPREPILHWQCGSCNFRSRAPSLDSLPDHVLFNQKYNVRYRWLFLAKSHCSASTPL
jgi:hypothetical protein